MGAKRYREIPSWVAVSGIVVCVINSLLLLFAMVDYLFYQVDLFGLVWMSFSFVGVVTVPLGLVMVVQSLFFLRSRRARIILFWSLGIAVLPFIVFGLLPPGERRAPQQMEKYYLKNRTYMELLARRLYEVMPDSTQLVYYQKGTYTVECLASDTDFWGYPLVKDSCADTVLALPPSLQDSLTSLMRSLRCKSVRLYKPTALARFHYRNSGFATYWFQLTLRPYTPEQMRRQLNAYNVIPFSPQVCFCYHGGATDGDGPFPGKDSFVQFLRHRGLLPAED